MYRTHFPVSRVYLDTLRKSTAARKQKHNHTQLRSPTLLYFKYFRFFSNIFLEKSRFWRWILVGSEGRWWRFDRVFHRRKSGTHDNQRSKNIIRIIFSIYRRLTCREQPMKLSKIKYFGDLTRHFWERFFRKMQLKSQDLGFEDLGLAST